MALRRFIAASLLGCLTFAPLAFAVGSDKAAYIGGTETQVKDNSEGTCSAKDSISFAFKSDGGDLSVPYAEVNDLEYGEKAGRRVGLAIALTPLALLSKKKKHYLTIGWKDDHDQQHAAVFELGKNIVRVTLVTLEARTGKKIDYQDDEARKDGEGGGR